MRLRLGHLIYAFVLFLILSPLARAQEAGINLVASPLPIALAAKPGETVSTELRIKNAGSTTEQLQVNLLKFSSNNDGEVKLEERSEGDDYFDWVTFSPKEFDAPPGQWKSVKMTINLPKDAAFGYYYGVSFSRAGKPQQTTTTAKLEGQLVTFVLLEVDAPRAKKELTVDSFITNKSVYEFLPVNFTVKVKNTGNLHVVPKGNIFITKGGKTVTTLDVNSTNGNVLPNSTRTFANQWSEGFPSYQPDGSGAKDKDGNLEQSLKWDFSKTQQLRFGKYTAKLVLVYNDGQRDIPIEGEVSFWVIPWRVIGGMVVVLGLMGVGIWSITRSIMRKIKKKSIKT